ncbi:MAG: histidine triad nucleotide-binding protein [Betaproteobacteria bacterium AqS2]|uniref:Histidine triad nucleotide-binding protein n=1 Tax=Candidatus Amphirhobacter heronislandensis TaxID=1732024 RepID=A0A930UHT3_9GAMM|nr:histidine triad nucleotide-binding protein [Betaproteobacteria bacterium AqS2]
MTEAPAYDESNVFARILRGEIPCEKVLETEHALAFADVNPQAPVHVLVIPKGAYVDLTDFLARAPAAERIGLADAVAATVAKLGVAASGYRILANCGPDAQQEVPHLHWHILAGERLGPIRARG